MFSPFIKYSKDLDLKDMNSEFNTHHQGLLRHNGYFFRICLSVYNGCKSLLQHWQLDYLPSSSNA